MTSAQTLPDSDGVPEPVSEGATARTVRLVPQTLEQIAAEWAEALERRHATEAVAGFWDAAVELHEGDRP